MMTIDVVLLTSLYTIAFVGSASPSAALSAIVGRIWAIDIAMQLGIARPIAELQGLPLQVAGRASHLARRKRQEGANQRLPMAALCGCFRSGLTSHSATA
jgi:hypothetical protein